MSISVDDRFYEALRKDFNSTDLRLQSPALLARNVDAYEANKLRLGIAHQKERMVRRMTERSGDYDEMEKLRGTKGDYGVDAREFALSDDIATMYFQFYGENFEGGEIVDNSEDGYTCPFCHIKYGMTLKLLPDHCLRCGHITPLGRLKKDGAFRR